MLKAGRPIRLLAVFWVSHGGGLNDVSSSGNGEKVNKISESLER